MKLLNLYWLILIINLIPLLDLGIDIFQNQLGANPIQAVHIRLGDWALRFLWLTLTITPLQTLSGWRGMARYRQLFGLYSFFYATLHLLVYLWVDQNWMWGMIAKDIRESSYIWFGLCAYFIIFLLGITSSGLAQRYLGKYWKKLHRWIYLASIAAMIHYFWQLKGNLAEPLVYTLILGLLFAFRIVIILKKSRLRKIKF